MQTRHGVQCDLRANRLQDAKAMQHRLDAWWRTFPELHYRAIERSEFLRQMRTKPKASGQHTIRGSKRSRRLAALSKGAWALFVIVQVAAAGLIFLLIFYLLLSMLGNLLGARFGLKEWRTFLGESLGPAAWLLVGFLAARLMSQLSLDLMERFRKIRCPDCNAELAPNEEALDRDALQFCPQCGAKL